MRKRTLATRMAMDDALVFHALARRDNIPVARLLRNLVKQYIAKEKRKAGFVDPPKDEYE